MEIEIRGPETEGAKMRWRGLSIFDRRVCGAIDRASNDVLIQRGPASSKVPTSHVDMKFWDSDSRDISTAPTWFTWLVEGPTIAPNGTYHVHGTKSLYGSYSTGGIIDCVGLKELR